MKKMSKKIISLLLAAMIVFGSVAVGVADVVNYAAATDGELTAEEKEELFKYEYVEEEKPTETPVSTPMDPSIGGVVVNPNSHTISPNFPVANFNVSGNQISNAYLSMYIYPEYGLFNLGTTGGNPDNAADNNKILSYRWPNSFTSYSTIVVDGSVKIYGKDGFVQRPLFNASQGNNVSVARYGDIEVKQILSIVNNNSTDREDVLEIKYEVTNTGTASHTVGTRIMIDTMLGSNDHAPFRVPGVGAVTTQTEFVGDNIPQYWQAFDSLENPSVIAQGSFLRTANRPDKVQLTNWGRVTSTPWNCPVSPGSNNGDSAVTVTWNEKALAAGETRTYATHYGLSEFVQAANGDLAVSLYGDNSISIVDGSYNPNPLTVTAYIQNTGDAPVENAYIELSTSSGALTVDDSTPSYISLGTIAPGAVVQKSWDLNVHGTSVDSVQTVYVRFGADDLEEETLTKNINVPGNLVGIEIRKLPDKTNYYLGDTLNTAGMMLVLSYADGSVATATTGFSCDPVILNTLGTQEITVTYSGFTDTFEVEVSERDEETTTPGGTGGGDGGDGTGGEGSGTGGDGTGGTGTTNPGGTSDPNPDGTYDVFYYVNGEIFAHYTAQPGMAVPVPGVNPAIDGLTFEGWTPAIATVMPENDLVYTAVFHGHSYEYTVVSQPDCTNHGMAVYTCSCGDNYTAIIPALGHDWGEWFVVIEATATENGLRKRICQRCAAEETEDIPAPEANFYVLDIADQEYSGYPIYPAVEAYSYTNERLDECFGDSPDESGYTVTYENNTDAGVATAIITGVGDYYGVIRKNFNIVRKDISDLDYADIPDVTDNGGVVTPDPVINDDGRVLVKDVDYVVEYENNGGAGQARIIVTGIGNYTGTLVIVFNIIENNTSITIPVIGTQVYTGSEIRPVFNLFSNGGVLVEGTDYTVEYTDNINVGYGRIIITGLGNYSGTIVIIFRIVGTEITMADIPVLPDAVYDRDYAPDFGTYPIIFNGRELVEGVDYDVVVRRNFSRGYYEIIIIGLGNFIGTITIYVNIIGYDLAQGGITIGRIPDMLYEGEPVTPDITVYGESDVLVENKDYIVEYRNNNSAGVATVIVKGIGAYRGTLTKTFVIYADNAYTLLIHNNKYELKYEQGVALKAEVVPVSDRNLTVVWSSSNPSVATVNQDGFVTSCGEGDVIITATLVDEYGRAVIDSYGDEISDSVVIKCTMTIWQKIIRFFRNLFSSIFSFNTVAAEAFKVR